VVAVREANGLVRGSAVFPVPVGKLRREKGVTQEEFANAIGVTAQAVSRWERNEGYPDITFLPVISEYFHVTLDTLCGMDEQRKEQEISSVLRATANASYEEGVRIAREGLAKFPHSILLKNNLAGALMGCTAKWTPPKDVLEEVIELYEDILRHCSIPKQVVFHVISTLSEVYALAGEREKAIEIALQIPGALERNHAWCRILQGEELVLHIQNSIIQTFPDIHFMLKNVLETDCYTTRERIALCKKMIDGYALFDECRDWPLGLIFSYQLYYQIAVLSMELGDTNESLNALDKASDLAIRTDSLPHEGFPSSLLLNRISFEYLSGCNEKETLFRKMEAEPVFEPLRKSSDYERIVSKLHS